MPIIRHDLDHVSNFFFTDTPFFVVDVDCSVVPLRLLIASTWTLL